MSERGAFRNSKVAATLKRLGYLYVGAGRRAFRNSKVAATLKLVVLGGARRLPRLLPQL